MKKFFLTTLTYFSFFKLALFAQTVSNGLSKIDTTVEFGGTINKDTKLRGYVGSLRYNLRMDTFNLLNYNGLRVDIEGSDSARLISNRLVKMMSLGDINIGASNSIILDGNLWLKTYKKNSLNTGILTVDTCGRVSIASDINQFKQGGNSFYNTAYLGTNDANDLVFQVNGTEKTRLSVDGTLWHNGLFIAKKGISVAAPDGGPSLRIGQYGNGYMHVFGNYATIFTAHNNGAFGSGPNMNFFSYYTGEDSSTNYFTFTGEQVGLYNLANKGDHTNVAIGRTFRAASNSTANFTGLYLTTGAFLPTNYAGITRGLHIPRNPGNENSRYRAIEVEGGNVYFNTLSGSTCIGCFWGDTIHRSASFEVRGVNYSGTKGFLPPRLLSNERNNIESAADGLIIYNSQFNRLEIHRPDGWHKFLTVPIDTPAVYGKTSATSADLNNNRTVSTFVTNIGDGKSLVFDIEHNLNSNFIMAQFIDCGPEANCNLLLSIPKDATIEINGSNSIRIIFKSAPAYKQYKVMLLKIQ